MVYLLSTTQFVDFKFPWNFISLEWRKAIPLTISLIKDILKGFMKYYWNIATSQRPEYWKMNGGTDLVLRNI